MTKNEENFATRNAMGTGPFMLKERKAGETHGAGAEPELVGQADPQPHRGDLHAVANPATRVAALMSGEIDMMYEVPPAGHRALKKDANIKVLEGPETRIVFSAWTSSATSCSSPTSRARTRSRTSACARPSTARSTSRRSSAP